MPTPGGIIPQIRAQRDIYEKARVLLCKIDWFSANGLPGVANKGTFSTGTYQMQGRVLPLPLELQEMLNSYLGSTHLWPAEEPGFENETTSSSIRFHLGHLLLLHATDSLLR